MRSTTHVVLGGNGVVGRETLRALLRRGETPVSVGRSASKVDGVRSITANLLVAEDAARALAGSEIAYLTVGLPYSARVYAEQWPVILRNTINAAITHETRLVYLDNVYAYGQVDTPMTEQTAISPSSRKGEVRAAALRMLAGAAPRGLEVTIGRSADFYGPGASTSVFNRLALDKIAAGKNGAWLIDADQPHSLSYTPDIGQGLAVLGTEPAARGGVWHLPTAPALTGRQYVELATGHGARAKVVTSTMLRIGGLINSFARETLEMAYQYRTPYHFDSRAFETTFGVAPTPTADGIAAALASAVPRGRSGAAA